jgi:hypothetical protein
MPNFASSNHVGRRCVARDACVGWNSVRAGGPAGGSTEASHNPFKTMVPATAASARTTTTTARR